MQEVESNASLFVVTCRRLRAMHHVSAAPPMLILTIFRQQART
jgi:hypothetical protein